MASRNLYDNFGQQFVGEDCMTTQSASATTGETFGGAPLQASPENSTLTSSTPQGPVI